MSRILCSLVLWTFFSGKYAITSVKFLFAHVLCFIELTVLGFVTSFMKHPYKLEFARSRSIPNHSHGFGSSRHSFLAPLQMASSDNDYYEGWDYYQILEADRNANPSELKSAYRTQVIK